MPRLPTPGGDNGNWGAILNDFLNQTHKADGSLKDGIVTEASLDASAQAKLNDSTGKVDKSLLTTKGDMFVASAAGTPTRLGAGADGQVLTADSSNARGLSWSTSAIKMPKKYFIDDYGADPTGVNDSNQALIDAYAALNGGPGAIVFGVGTYKLFVGLNAASGRLIKPLQAVIGQGSGLTKIDYRGTGAFLEFRDMDFDNTSVSHQHGGCQGLNILGWNNGNSNTCAIRYGDIWRMRISDVEISGFNQPGDIGLWGDNQYRWSERAFIECVVNQCTECFVFESNTGDPSSGSFDYSQYWLSFVVQPDQHAFVLRSGTAGSRTSMNGASVTLTGNCQLSSGPGIPNTGVMFRVGKNDADPATFSGDLNIGVETSGSTGGVGHIDFMMGSTTSFWNVQSKVTASGSINLIPFSGARFQSGNATPNTFAFGGMLKNSPTLGSTGTVQSFQSLQLVSQARGGWYLDQTRALQSIYIKEATGGTFTISFNGLTTPALAHDAPSASVKTALENLASIGVGNVEVTSGHARYINSIAQDEHEYAIEFVSALASTPVSLITVDSSNLTGGPGVGADVVEKNTGSPHDTYVFYIENGSIFHVEPPPGTYRVKFNIGGLTSYGSAQSGGDSPFGITTVDIWIKQPDTGGNVFLEPPFFAPEAYAGSTYSFRWVDGVNPVLSTVPGDVDIIRLTSYNFSVWVGDHLTRVATTTVPTPASATSPGVQGQIAYDADYVYVCTAPNTWKRSPIGTW